MRPRELASAQHPVQQPLAERPASRLLHVRRGSGEFQDQHFHDFPELLRPDDLLVLNKDYFDTSAVPDAMLKTVRPLLTMVGGRIEYLDPGLAREVAMQPAGIHPEQLISQIEKWESGVDTQGLDSTSNTDQ